MEELEADEGTAAHAAQAEPDQARGKEGARPRTAGS
jgi:hypothetical protein